MGAQPLKKSEIESICADLFNYAIDREDIKYLIALLPWESTIKRSKADYELQILKIITVGWTLSYQLQDHPLKEILTERFWLAMQEFSHNLSETTSLMIGQDINYFDTLKQRLDKYVAAISDHPEATEPAPVIGTAFARCCGDKNDLFVFMTGSKMFLSATSRVKQYLETAMEKL
jgi:hypothetical protein